MKTFAKIGLGLLAFGFFIAVLGAIVIRTSAPRPPSTQTSSASVSAVASSMPQSSASLPSTSTSTDKASAAVQNSGK